VKDDDKWRVEEGVFVTSKKITVIAKIIVIIFAIVGMIMYLIYGGGLPCH